MRFSIRFEMHGALKARKTIQDRRAPATPQLNDPGEFE